MHKAGQKGPKKTTPKHDKKNVKWKSPEAAQSRANVLKKSHVVQDGKSVLDKMNEKKEKVKLGKRGQEVAGGHRDLQNLEIVE